MSDEYRVPGTTDTVNTDQIAQHAAGEAARGHRGFWIALGAALLLMVGVLLISLYTYGQARDLAAQQSDAARAAQALHSQVLALGAKPVTQAPAPVTGVVGPSGPAGRGITETHIVAGDLYVIYTDGSSVDVGRVLGTAGATGATGRGITASTVSQSGDLLLTYSDGANSNVGHVVGSQGQQGVTGQPGTNGVGVSLTAITDGNLVLTYTDGHTQTVGPVVGPPGATGPAGAPGATGADGQPPASWTYTDALGLSHTCDRVTGFDPAAPRYQCS